MNLRIKLGRDKLLRLLDGFPVQTPTGVGLLELEAEPKPKWRPLRQVPLSDEARRFYEATMGEQPVEVWSNELYEVIVRRNDHDESMGGTHLSVKRRDRAPIRNWRHFQQIKNEVCGPNYEAVELFPAEARIVDNANQYHLWVLPAGQMVPLGFPQGMVVRDDEDVAEYNSLTPKGRQEPMQPGLTTGEAMDAAAKAQGIHVTDYLRDAQRRAAT